MRPLDSAAEKMLRECLGYQAALPNILPRYPRVDGESWVQRWVEKVAVGLMLMVCRAHRHEMEDRTGFGQGGGGSGLKDIRSPPAAAGGGVTR